MSVVFCVLELQVSTGVLSVGLRTRRSHACYSVASSVSFLGQ